MYNSEAKRKEGELVDPLILIIRILKSTDSIWADCYSPQLPQTDEIKPLV